MPPSPVTVTNTATLPINYQWRKGTFPLTNMLLYSTTSSFTLFNVQTNVTTTNGPGSYRVVLSNAATAGSPSSPVTLKVAAAVPMLVMPAWQGNQFTISVATLTGSSYYLERKGSLSDPNWIVVASVAGNNLVQMMADPIATAAQGYYRVRLE